MPEASTNITIQAQSTAFDRFGNSRQFKGYDFTVRSAGDIPAYVEAAFKRSALPLQINADEQALLDGLITQDKQCLPGGQTLADIQALIPDEFNGSAELQVLYRRDPFSTQYEEETADLYDRQFLIARSTAQSGPVNVRGGTARMGFELAELDTQQAINRFREIWQAQMRMAEIVQASVQLANAVEAERRTAMLNAQRQQAATEHGQVMQSLAASEIVERIRSEHTRANAAAAEFLGVPNMLSYEDIHGQGFQQGITTAFGSSYWR